LLELVPTIILEHWYLLPAFFCVAALYSAVGFGGGSSYLAILAISSIEFRSLRAIALLCNITVVAGGTYIFFRNGHLQLRKTIPLVVASVPLAFWGGRFRLSEDTFFLLLGAVLVAAAILLWLQPKRKLAIDDETQAVSSDESSIGVETEFVANGAVKQWAVSAGTGGLIGLLSGIVGIGGGIFLSPTLNLMRWDHTKVISATASLFILVNSIAGLLGQSSQANFSLDWTLAIALMVCVFLGGQLGARFGAKTLPAHVVRKLTAALVLIVGVKQFFR
jgi:uncharacterized membrane protein YfcA